MVTLQQCSGAVCYASDPLVLCVTPCYDPEAISHVSQTPSSPVSPQVNAGHVYTVTFRRSTVLRISLRHDTKPTQCGSEGMSSVRLNRRRTDSTLAQ